MKNNNFHNKWKEFLLTEAPKDKKYLLGINQKQLQSTVDKEPEEEIRDYFTRLSQKAEEGPIFDSDTLKYIEDMSDEEFPKKARKMFAKWIANNLEGRYGAKWYHSNYYDEELPDESAGIKFIRDFIEGSNPPENIWNLNYKEMIFAAGDWDAIRDIKVPPQGEFKYQTKDIVYELDKGYSIVKVPISPLRHYTEKESLKWHFCRYAEDCLKKNKSTPEQEEGTMWIEKDKISDLDIEGAKMQHCIGTGNYCVNISYGEIDVFSLRDEQNEPHATIEIDNDGGFVNQIKGKQNASPTEKYATMVKEWLYSMFKDTHQAYMLSDDFLALLSIDELEELINTGVDKHTLQRYIYTTHETMSDEIRIIILQKILSDRRFADIQQTAIDSLFEDIENADGAGAILNIINLEKDTLDTDQTDITGYRLRLLGTLLNNLSQIEERKGHRMMPSESIDMLGDIFTSEKFSEVLDDLSDRSAWVGSRMREAVRRSYIYIASKGANPEILSKIHHLTGTRVPGEKSISKERHDIHLGTLVLRNPNSPIELVDEYLDGADPSAPGVVSGVKSLMVRSDIGSPRLMRIYDIFLKSKIGGSKTGLRILVKSLMEHPKLSLKDRIKIVEDGNYDWWFPGSGYTKETYLDLIRDQVDLGLLKIVEHSVKMLSEIYVKRDCEKKTTGEKGHCAVISHKTNKQKACYDNCDIAKKATHLEEEVDEYFSSIQEDEDDDNEEFAIKNRQYDLIDLMDPDFNPWKVL